MEIYSPGYIARNHISEDDKMKVPKTILVRGIPGEGTHPVTLEYKGGVRFINSKYRMEPYSGQGTWWWALYRVDGNTRLGRKATEASALMSEKPGSKWSFTEEASPALRFVEKELTIENGGTSRDVVALRERGNYLPLQPRRLATRLEAPWQSAGYELGAMMADLTEIKRALNGASLLAGACIQFDPSRTSSGA